MGRGGANKQPSGKLPEGPKARETMSDIATSDICAARLNHERYMMRLPQRLQNAVKPHTNDLLTMLYVTLTRYPIPAFKSATWTYEPPGDVLDEQGTHGDWLASRVNTIVQVLEPFAATGRIRKK